MQILQFRLHSYQVLADTVLSTHDPKTPIAFAISSNTAECSGVPVSPSCVIMSQYTHSRLFVTIWVAYLDLFSLVSAAEDRRPPDPAHSPQLLMTHLTPASRQAQHQPSAVLFLGETTFCSQFKVNNRIVVYVIKIFYISSYLWFMFNVFWKLDFPI